MFFLLSDKCAMAGLCAPSFLDSTADNGSVSGLSGRQSARNHLQELEDNDVQDDKIKDPPLSVNLSGDPFVLQVQRAIAPGLWRTLRYSSKLILLQTFRTPESINCILRCLMHLLDDPEVTTQTTLSLEVQAWLWPKECYIHQRLRDGLLRKPVPS